MESYDLIHLPWNAAPASLIRCRSMRQLWNLPRLDCPNCDEGFILHTAIPNGYRVFGSVLQKMNNFKRRPSQLIGEPVGSCLSMTPGGRVDIRRVANPS